MPDCEKKLEEILNKIWATDETAREAARARQARLAKPPGSLGVLEDISVQVAGITGRVFNRLDDRALLVFCADNGVVEEGVSVAPKSVTLKQAKNLANGVTGAGVLANAAGARVYVYDVGIDGDADCEKIIDRKITRGTKNIAAGAAMTRAQAARAVLVGAGAAADAVKNGARIIGVGELGIGNTTTSAAVLAALTGKDPGETAGRGGGLTDAGMARKLKVIKTALEVNMPDSRDVLDVISKVGGYDIAAMTGAFIGAASLRVPAVTDGFISAVSALCAVRRNPLVREYLIASHSSCEKGYAIAADELGIKPMLDLKMRLGEGSGCPAAMLLADHACRILNEMATFDEAGIDDGYLDEIRANERNG
ncbi:MAG: nicotinate-nucleotide--dimethylbenzimidazole phosphoribosyltransferase, partial [Clostridia bacterium]|nr:nicotinate-nucleotide--dimethylbenzimidazole phosphoribosyltransferase [Clostridia bacterium]